MSDAGDQTVEHHPACAGRVSASAVCACAAFEIFRLRQQVADLLDVLSRVEFGGTEECGYPVCPLCGGLDPKYISHGIPATHPDLRHRPDCALRAALDGGRP